jgi:peroxiredoxin Q/BCP
MPAFELNDGAGKAVTSASLMSGGPLVIYFYPRDFTPGCTAEACAFRDHHEDFAALGATVVGISSDPPERHAEFAAAHGLHFLLLSDPDKQVLRRFGVRPVFGLFAGRETFVVDRKGVIRQHIRANFNPRRHIAEALKAVRELHGEDKQG